jgi:hypothetical protein
MPWGYSYRIEGGCDLQRYRITVGIRIGATSWVQCLRLIPPPPHTHRLAAGVARWLSGRAPNITLKARAPGHNRCFFFLNQYRCSPASPRACQPEWGSINFDRAAWGFSGPSPSCPVGMGFSKVPPARLDRDLGSSSMRVPENGSHRLKNKRTKPPNPTKQETELQAILEDVRRQLQGLTAEHEVGTGSDGEICRPGERQRACISGHRRCTPRPAA